MVKGTDEGGSEEESLEDRISPNVATANSFTGVVRAAAFGVIDKVAWASLRR